MSSNMKLLKGLLKALSFIFLGIVGGMLWQTILIPYLAEQPSTSELWFVRNYRERQVNLYPHRETIIRENEAVTEAVRRVESSVVAVKTASSAGSGLVYTTDGLVVTFSELIPASGEFSLWVDGEKLEATVEKRDKESGLALLKMEENGFSTTAFAPVHKLEKAERVFTIGNRFSSQGVPERVVNEGTVREVQEDFIYVNMREKDYMQGSVLFDIEGQVIGLNRIGLEGEVLTVPVSTIEEFVNS